ncbi:hypothetical protein ABEF95_001872 [Exophiala dermatitidis]
MDHLYELFAKGGTGNELPRVPYLCKQEYNNQCSFAEYPSKQGFDKARFIQQDFDEHDSIVTAAFLQTWLYFGLLNRLLRLPIIIDDFVDRSQAIPVVTTAKSLPSYLDRWSRKVEARYVDEMLADIDEARSHVLAMLRAGSSCPLPEEVILSIMVLGSSLTCAIALKIPAYPPESHTSTDEWGVSSLLTKRLLNAGWCINDAHRLFHTVTTPTAIVASSIRRCEVISSAQHQRCSPDKCIARNFVEGTYTTKHTEPACSCKIVPVPVHEVKETLDRGGVPVIIFRDNTGGEGEVQLEVSSDRKTKYVAISHVWADGLGCTENSLPLCQLRRLQGLCNDISAGPSSISLKLLRKPEGRNAFWIDTLCVPREKAHRRLAISRMNTTYAKAQKVIILDSELLSLCKATPETLLLLHMIGTGWMRRVWTMQEGALGSKNLHVRLRDGFSDISAIFAKLRKSLESTNLATTIVDRDATIFYEEFDNLRRAHSQSYWRDGVPAIAASLRILNGRSTSKEGDAYICLAGMMGLKAEIIKNLDAAPLQDRTMMMLSQLHYLPKHIIFSPGTKLTAQYYRWACTSFWTSKFSYKNWDEVGKLYDGIGLRVEFQGFVLEPLILPLEYIVLQSVHTKMWFKATYDTAMRSQPGGSGPQTYGVICPERKFLIKGLGGLQVPAALVLIPPRKISLKEKFSEDRNIVYCEYVCQIMLSTPTPSDLKREAPYGKARRPYGTQEPPGMGIVYTPQTWIIS